MADDQGVSVQAESPAATADSSSPAASAPGPNGAQPSAKLPPFNTHPDWIKMHDRLKAAEAKNVEFERRWQDLQSRTAPPPRPPEEHVRAAAALEQVMAANPKLARLLQLAERSPELLEGYKGVQTLTRQQTEAAQRAGREQIRAFAQAEGLPMDKEDIATFIEDMVAGHILRQGGRERFLSGDGAVVKDAVQFVKDNFLALLQRGANLSVAATKAKVSALPPAPRGGGLVGPEAPPKLVPGKEREYEAAVLKQGRAMLDRLTKG